MSHNEHHKKKFDERIHKVLDSNDLLAEFNDLVNVGKLAMIGINPNIPPPSQWSQDNFKWKRWIYHRLHPDRKIAQKTEVKGDKDDEYWKPTFTAFCSASILNQKKSSTYTNILTAAHCIEREDSLLSPLFDGKDSTIVWFYICPPGKSKNYDYIWGWIYYCKGPIQEIFVPKGWKRDGKTDWNFDVAVMRMKKLDKWKIEGYKHRVKLEGLQLVSEQQLTPTDLAFGTHKISWDSIETAGYPGDSNKLQYWRWKIDMDDMKYQRTVLTVNGDDFKYCDKPRYISRPFFLHNPDKNLPQKKQHSLLAVLKVTVLLYHIMIKRYQKQVVDHL